MTEDKKERKIFSTRDLSLAATLITLKFPLEEVTFQIEGIKQQPVGYFIFADNDDLRDAQGKFNRRELMVEPREFQENIRNLKSQVANVYKSPYSDYAKFNDKK